MARRLNVQRLILVMGALVLALGALSAWVVYQNARPPAEPTADERALRQVREQRGSAFDVRYAEAGRGRAVCGYAGPRNRKGAPGLGGYDAVAFVSRPNRILFSDDPLPVEFREIQQRFCPDFLANPVPPVS
ncbi:hypothetical protein BH10PSE1_BH10PSE1_28950 [soil metagenome]